MAEGMNGMPGGMLYDGLGANEGDRVQKQTRIQPIVEAARQATQAAGASPQYAQLKVTKALLNNNLAQ